MEVTHKHVEAGAHGSEQEKKARAHGGEKDQELMEAVGRKS